MQKATPRTFQGPSKLLATAMACTALSVSAQVPDITLKSDSTIEPYTTSCLISEWMRTPEYANASLTINGTKILATINMLTNQNVPLKQISAYSCITAPPGNYTLEVIERGVAVPERRSPLFAITVKKPEQPSVATTTLWDRKAKKFFLTASAADADTLIARNNTATGPEWMRVEDNIRVWATAQEFTQPVCRFYAAAAGSHFMSADTFNDCNKLRGVAGFVDEGIAFHAIAPLREFDYSDTGGPRGNFLNICPAGTDPVYRLFDRTPGKASHRYTTSFDVVKSAGLFNSPSASYQFEGVAFCSPRE
jgi:hypothetical protein